MFFGLSKCVVCQAKQNCRLPNRNDLHCHLVYSLKFALLGDMLINAYYFLMSAYGGIFATKTKWETVNPIAVVIRKGNNHVSTAIHGDDLLISFTTALKCGEIGWCRHHHHRYFFCGHVACQKKN